MQNVNSTSGMSEDIIRAIGQLGATELHLKTLYEKTLAEMENGIVDVSDPDILVKSTDKLNDYLTDLQEITQLRRQTMLALYNMYDGDKDAWCLVKHLSIANECMFEAWQGSDNDPELLQLAIDTNKQFVKAITRFIGAEISSCAACLSDFLKAGGNNEDN